MRRKKKLSKKPGPKAVRLVIETDWQEAMRASVVMDAPAKGRAKK